MLVLLKEDMAADHEPVSVQGAFGISKMVSLGILVINFEAQ